MFKKVISVLLAVVVFAATSGITISSHICGGKRVETVISVMRTDVSCGMEKEDATYSNGEKINSNCCQDEFQLIKIEEDYTQQLMKDSFSPDFTIAFVMVLFDLLPNITVQTLFFKDYSPPPLVRNIPVLVQSFLI